MQYHLMMRTTLDIDEDVLQAAKELASAEKTTAGRILSRFFRKGLHAAKGERGVEPGDSRSARPVLKNGIPVLRSRGAIVTTEKVRQIMDDEGI